MSYHISIKVSRDLRKTPSLAVNVQRSSALRGRAGSKVTDGGSNPGGGPWSSIVTGTPGGRVAVVTIVASHTIGVTIWVTVILTDGLWVPGPVVGMRPRDTSPCVVGPFYKARIASVPRTTAEGSTRV